MRGKIILVVGLLAALSLNYAYGKNVMPPADVVVSPNESGGITTH